MLISGKVMSTEQALNVLAGMVGQVRTTLEEHQLAQVALGTIQKALSPKVPKDDGDDKHAGSDDSQEGAKVIPPDPPAEE